MLFRIMLSIFPDIAGDEFGANASREGVDVRRPGPYLDTFLLHAR